MFKFKKLFVTGLLIVALFSLLVVPASSWTGEAVVDGWYYADYMTVEEVITFRLDNHLAIDVMAQPTLWIYINQEHHIIALDAKEVPSKGSATWIWNAAPNDTVVLRHVELISGVAGYPSNYVCWSICDAPVCVQTRVYNHYGVLHVDGNEIASRTYADCPLCGDVTGNGVINMGDVALLHSYVAHPGQYELNCVQCGIPCGGGDWCGDVTGDGEINMGDVSALYSYVASQNPAYLNCHAQYE